MRKILTICVILVSFISCNKEAVEKQKITVTDVMLNNIVSNGKDFNKFIDKRISALSNFEIKSLFEFSCLEIRPLIS